MYQVSCKNVERFLSYEVRLKFLDDDDDADADDDADDAKAITITRLFFLRKTDELKTTVPMLMKLHR